MVKAEKRADIKKKDGTKKVGKREYAALTFRDTEEETRFMTFDEAYKLYFSDISDKSILLQRTRLFVEPIKKSVIRIHEVFDPNPELRYGGYVPLNYHPNKNVTFEKPVVYKSLHELVKAHPSVLNEDDVHLAREVIVYFKIFPYNSRSKGRDR